MLFCCLMISAYGSFPGWLLISPEAFGHRYLLLFFIFPEKRCFSIYIGDMKKTFCYLCVCLTGYLQNIKNVSAAAAAGCQGEGLARSRSRGRGAQQDVQLCDGNRKCANSRALRIFTLSTILHGIGAVAACRAQCQLSGSIYISIAYIPIFSCQQIRHSTGRTGAEQQCSWQATMPLDSRYAFVFSLYSDVVTHPAAQSMQAFNWVTRKSVER
uniref:HDC16016 n=1 Tax=Drosophila melanogaster TaxID=7227 RepID=Q6IJ42_DROME|nr:TPA_inf: HDC16016 [Drosophila melanogaster]